ncbi:MAG: hypothetical protein CMI18_14445 [Opitutaceae bacterium]|nr:hypothetical protein [Opitutaceae bacterium]|tara:strand:+ start:5823 stop:6659 length:837 start_codon:yes stop_codon:yes gene_type:complete
MFKENKGLILAGLVTCLPVFSFAQNLIQIKLQDLQVRQKRLIKAHRAVTNRDDQDSIEFRLFALRDEYQVLLSKNPDNVAVLVTYGLFLVEIDQRDDSLKLLLKADALEPEHPQVKNQLGNFMIEEANFAMALPYYLDAIALAPKEPLYHYQLGNLLFHFKRQFIEEEVFTEDHLHSQIFNSFKQAAVLGKDNLAFQYRYAEAFYDYPKADLKEALKEWQRIEGLTDLERDKQMTRLHQANLQLMLGNKELAKVILEKVRDPFLDPHKEILLEKLKEE